jgi:hypothetical protein
MPKKNPSVHEEMPMLAYLCMLMAVVYLPLVNTEAVAGGTRVTVAFRYDDPAARTSSEIEAQLIEAFRQHNMCCTFAVIPFVCAGDSHDPAPQDCLPLPEKKGRLFADAVREGVLEVAQHGCFHQTNGLHSGKYSEFGGLDYESQWRKIERGKQFLETELGCCINTFVPPWDDYDTITLCAVGRAGFQCLSGAVYGVGPVDATSSLRFAPVTCGISTLQSAVLVARRLHDPAPIIVVLFHAGDFREVDEARGIITLNEFHKILVWLSAQQDVNVRRLGDIGDVSGQRYLENQRLLRTRLRLPAVLRSCLYPSIYLSEGGIRSLRLRCVLLLGAFYGTILLVAGLVSYVMGKLLPVFASRPLLPLGLLLLVGGSVWAFPAGHFGERTLVALSTVLGFCGGALAARLLHRRKHGLGLSDSGAA